MLNNKSVAENQKIKILYAEDIPEMRKMAEYFLKKDFEVQSAVDGQEAFEMFIKNRDKFSLLLTDNNMPHCNGIDLTKRIRALKSNIPIIVYSSDVRQQQEFLSAGANFFIDKNGSTGMKDIMEIIRFFSFTRID